MSTQMTDDFGELRSIAQAPYNDRSWELLVRSLNQWRDHERLVDVVLPYLSAHIARWPSQDRLAIQSWWFADEAGQLIALHPAFALANAITLRPDSVAHALLLLEDPALEAMRWITLDLSLAKPTQAQLFELFERESLSKVTGLYIWNASLSGPSLLALADCPWLGRLVELDLSFNDAGDELADAIARSSINTLRTLRLSDNNISEDGALVLAQSPKLSELSSLSMASNPLGAQGFEALLALESLRSLDLRHIGLRSSAASQLGALNPARTLQDLNLSGNLIEEPGALALVGNPDLVSLKKLELIRAGLTPRSALALASVAHLNALTHLHLGHNHIADEGVIAIAASEALERLEELSLHHTELGDKALKALCQSPHMRKLETLSLSDNHITDQGILDFAAHSELLALTRLDLSGNPLTDKSAVALADYIFTTNLIKLGLNHTQIGDEGAQALAQSIWTSSMLFLDMHGTAMTDAGRSALAASPYLSLCCKQNMGVVPF